MIKALYQTPQGSECATLSMIIYKWKATEMQAMCSATTNGEFPSTEAHYTSLKHSALYGNGGEEN